jgi:cell division protein FtsL
MKSRTSPVEKARQRFGNGANLHAPAADEYRRMRRNFKKIFLIIVCGVVACAAISHMVRSWRTKQLKQEIADIRRTMREQGFKTELDDFKITTDAAMRARVVALTALGYELKLNTNEDILVIQPVVSNGVASVLWKQDALHLGNKPYQWAYLRAALNKEHVRLDAACDAALSGPLQSDFDLTNYATPWNGNIGHLHRVSQALGYRVILNLHDGNSDLAWTNLLAATRLVTAWKVEPTPIAHMVHISMADNDFALIWQALQFRPWPDDRLAALQSEWEIPNFFTNLSETMGLERAWNLHRCEQLLLKPPSGNYGVSDIAKRLFDHPSEAFQEAGENYQVTHYRGNKVLNDEKNLLQFLWDRELEMRRAAQSPTWMQIRTQPGITSPPQFKSPSEGTSQYVNVSALSASRLTAFASVAETERRILITAIALERYRGKHGAYPNSLAQLSPEFLKAVPLDFMDGQPLRYRPTADGHFLLYSVGLDCVDDGGKPPAPDFSPFGSFEHGMFAVPKHVDIVWPVPASP